MASNLVAMTSNLEAMASNLIAMASNLRAMARFCWMPHFTVCHLLHQQHVAIWLTCEAKGTLPEQDIWTNYGHLDPSASHPYGLHSSFISVHQFIVLLLWFTCVSPKVLKILKIHFWGVALQGIRGIMNATDRRLFQLGCANSGAFFKATMSPVSVSLAR